MALLATGVVLSPGPHRCAITGLGAVTALGPDVESSWRLLTQGETGIKEVSAWDPDCYPTSFAGEATSFDPSAHFEPRRARRLDRCHQLELVAAREAVRDAGIGEHRHRERVGVVLGSSLGGMNAWLKFQNEYVRHGRKRRAVYLRDHFMHRCLDLVSSEFGFLGPRAIFSTACTASTVALAHGFELIRNGSAETVLVGGLDPLSEFSFAGFSAMRNVSAAPCAPFSEPIGLSTGEGAAFLIFEDWQQALARGARIYAEFLGYGLSSDAYHPTAPDPVGQSQRRALEETFAMAGVGTADVDYVNAHGTGTVTNDATKSRLLASVIGPRIAEVPVSSLKGALGHTLGAAGAIEALFTVKAISEGVLPPTANFNGARTGCALDYVPVRRAHRIELAISQNFAFGGNNASLMFGHPSRPPSALPAARPGPRRVVITGMGPVSPIGCGKDEFLAALQAQRCGITALPVADPLALTEGARIEDFDPSRYARFQSRRMDKFGQLIVCSAMLAAQDSGLKIGKDNANRIGIVGGTAYGPMTSCDDFNRYLVEGQPAKANPAVFPNTVFNAGVGLASIQLRVRGCNLIICNGQSAGIDAIAFAAQQIRAGQADVIFAGGADELSDAVRQIFGALVQYHPGLGVVAGNRQESRPFSAHAAMPAMGEGAAFFAVEDLDYALGRGAHIYCELTAHHSFADEDRQLGWDTSGSSMIRGMETILDKAKLRPDNVDLVIAGAFAHPNHDQIEARALNAVFGCGCVPVMAPASLLGISGATGALGLSAALIGMRDGFLPSGAATPTRTGACADLDLIEGGNRSATINTVLVNASSLGGGNASILVQRYDPAS